jgi:hypothetical protein
MNAASRQLIAQAHRRARSVAGARDPQLRDALIRRVLFDLRTALTPSPKPLTNRTT